jgi:uncharacterized membrane protein
MAEIYQNPPVIQEKINNGYSFSIGSVVEEAWRIFKLDPGKFIGFSVVVFAVNMALGLIPFVGSLVSLLITPALTVGYIHVARQLDLGNQVRFEDFFRGFDKFGELFLVYLVAIIFIFIGTLLLVLPGIYLAVCYTPLMFALVWYHYDGSVMNTLETMRKLVTKRWWTFLGLGIVSAFIIILGVIALGVGLLIAVPVVNIIYYTVYKSVIGFDAAESEDDHLILNEDI